MTQYQIPTKFHLSDATAKLADMSPDAVLDIVNEYGNQETVLSLKESLDEVIDQCGDLYINEIEGEDCIKFLRKILGE